MGTSLGNGNIWSETVFAPSTVQSLRGSHQVDPRRSGTSASSPSPTSPPPSRSRLVASGASPMSGDTPCRILPGDTQPCRLLTGELFRSNKTCQEQIYDCGHRCGTLSLWGGEHLWRQRSGAILTAKGVSRRIPWPGAPSRILTVKGVNPQNTLAKSKAMLSMCLKSSRPLEFFQCLWFSQVSFLFLYKILQVFLILSKFSCPWVLHCPSCPM